MRLLLSVEVGKCAQLSFVPRDIQKHALWVYTETFDSCCRYVVYIVVLIVEYSYPHFIF